MASPKYKNLKFDYDKQRDVLYAFIERPVAATCEETNTGVLIRKDVQTGVVVGFTVYNYSRKKKRGQLENIPHFPGVSIPF